MDSSSPNQHQPTEEAKQSPSPTPTPTPTPCESQGESQSRTPSVDGDLPMGEQAIVPFQAGAPEPMDEEAEGQDEADGDLLLALGREEDREYGCKFCEKKFSNKQALGGHQNAHKVERTVEKSTHHMHENHLGFFAAPGQSSNGGNGLLNLINPSNNLLNRAYISWTHPVQQVQQQQFFGPRPMMQMGEPFGPRPVFNMYQQSWNQAGPSVARMAPFMVTNPNYLNQSGGGFVGLGAGPRPVYHFQAGAGYPGPLRIGPERNNPGVNLRNVPGGDVDESGLDLSLHL